MRDIKLTNNIVRKYLKLWAKLCTTSEEYPVYPFRLRNVKYIKRLGVVQGSRGDYQLFEIEIGTDKENDLSGLCDLLAVYLDKERVTMVEGLHQK